MFFSSTFSFLHLCYQLCPGPDHTKNHVLYLELLSLLVVASLLPFLHLPNWYLPNKGYGWMVNSDGMSGLTFLVPSPGSCTGQGHGGSKQEWGICRSGLGWTVKAGLGCCHLDPFFSLGSISRCWREGSIPLTLYMNTANEGLILILCENIFYNWEKEL